MLKIKKYFEKKTIQIDVLSTDRWGLDEFRLSINEQRNKAWLND